MKRSCFWISAAALTLFAVDLQAANRPGRLPVPHVTVGPRTVGMPPPRVNNYGGGSCGFYGHHDNCTPVRSALIIRPPVYYGPFGSPNSVYATVPGGPVAPPVYSYNTPSQSTSASSTPASTTTRPSTPAPRPVSRDFDFDLHDGIFVRTIYRTASGLSADHGNLDQLQVGQSVTVRLKNSEEVTGTVRVLQTNGSSRHMVVRVQGVGEIPDLASTEVVTLFIKTPVSRAVAAAN